jgi:hypothetical protein
VARLGFLAQFMGVSEAYARKLQRHFSYLIFHFEWPMIARGSLARGKLTIGVGQLTVATTIASQMKNEK